MIAQMTRAVLFAIIIASGSKLGSGRITLGSDTEYFDDEFGIEIDRKEYRGAGTSKMNRLRTFFRVSDPALVYEEPL
jgi:hypothetical protein